MMKGRFLLVIILMVIITACNQDKEIDKKELFARGADVGWLTEMEAAGRKFYNTNGIETECLSLLKQYGVNTVRLRIWVNPTDGWSGQPDLLAQAKRAHDLGMRIMINFHYSDIWADPGNQTKPLAWDSLPFDDLKQAVTDHTLVILNSLKNIGVEPEWVQVGNETANGMLWPEGKLNKGFEHYSILNNAGYDAVKSVFPNAKVIVHLQNGERNKLSRWFFDGLKEAGGKWDVIGLSVYPHWAEQGWQLCNQNALDNMNDLVETYDTEVMVVEAGHPWDRPAESKMYLADLMDKVQSVKRNKGIGVVYWEPQCYNSWKGYNLGCFDNDGQPTIALDAFKLTQ